MIKYNQKYTYTQGTQITDQGTRNYDIAGQRLPSVPTILGKTKDNTFLKKWIKDKGEKEAERIKNLSSRRGTAMHRYIEYYLQQKGYEDMTSFGQEAKRMARKVIETGLAPVNEYYGSEVTLYYPGLYAGSTDLVCLHNDKETIVDFKQSNRPKREEWITDYKLQGGAYAMAHDCIYGSKVEQVVIMMCTPDLYYQQFVLNGARFRQYKWKWLWRLSEYYKQKV